jgi:hypothetical protein
LLVLGAVAALTASCGRAEEAAPGCEPDQRLGIVAQSLPTASYVPCIVELAPGWSFRTFEVDDRGTSLTLGSDRADEPVEVELRADCDIEGAVPISARAEGVRTYQLLTGITPTYAGTLFDVFPGGCITYRFRFDRGPHIALMDELQRTVALYSRRQLRQDLRAELGLDLEP